MQILFKSYTPVARLLFTLCAASGALLGGTAFFAVPQAHAALTDGLVGHWKFDEGTGTTAADASGNGNTGTLTNGPTWTAGKIGAALSFDGVNDKVRIPDSPSWKVASSTGYTVSLWVRADEIKNYQTPIAIGRWNYDGLYLYAANNAWSYLINTAGGPNNWNGIFNTTPALPYLTNLDGAFHHIVIVLDTTGATGPKGAVYSDSVLIRSNTYVDGTTSFGVGDLFISCGDVGMCWHGAIDDVRIYNRALSASEVQELYNSTGTSPGDTIPPARSNGTPSGTLAEGTAQTTLSLATDENATCRYAATSGTSYDGMPGFFSSTSGLSHSFSVSGLQAGSAHTYYIRCQDSAGNANADDFIISFSVASDAAPPVISSVAASSITSSGATITWTTNENADSQVEYGLTTAYGSTTALDAALTASHSQTLSGLSANTIYYYRVKSKDAAGNITVSPGYTLNTLQGGAYEYTLVLGGPHYVVRGNNIFIHMVQQKTTASSTNRGVIIGAEDMPSGATYVIPEMETAGLRYPNYRLYPGGSSSFQIKVPASAPPGTYDIKITGTIDGVKSSFPYTIIVTDTPSMLPSQPMVSSPIPRLGEWENNMRQWGQYHCNRNTIQTTGTWEGAVWYYDGERVFYQIGDYLNDRSWDACAGYVEEMYRNYVITTNGQIPGYRVFTQGLKMDYLKTGDEESKRAVDMLAQSSYAAERSNLSYTIKSALSREATYALEALIDNEELTGIHKAKTDYLADISLGHIDQWFISKNAPYRKAFMVGLTMEALIKYYEKTGDPRIPSAIKTAADGLWETNWYAPTQGFMYCDVAGIDDCNRNSARGLNLLIAPAYAWLYKETGDPTYKERGDLAFDGAVAGVPSGDPWFNSGKQFSQNYRWSFDYIKWRTAATSTTNTPPTPPHDTTPPSISSAPVVSNITSSSATITWTTNEQATSRLIYGTSPANIMVATSETDTTTRVTTHTYNLSNLLPCAVYHAKAFSRDAAGNSAQSSAVSFATTPGCPGGIAPLKTAEYVAPPVIQTVNTFLDTDSHTLTLTSPQGYYATSTDIQIKSFNPAALASSFPVPSGKVRLGNYLRLSFIEAGVTAKTSLAKAVTLEKEIPESALSSVDRHTARWHHWNGTSWELLSGCATTATPPFKVSCNANAFSFFAIFADPAPSGGGSSSGGSPSGGGSSSGGGGSGSSGSVSSPTSATTTPAPVSPIKGNASAPAKQAAQKLLAPSRTLSFGMKHSDVKLLQALLMAEGLMTHDTPTDFFGKKTRAAVISFQERYAKDVLLPAGLSRGTGFVGSLTLKKLAELSGTGTAQQQTQTTPTSPSSEPVLAKGMRGPSVKALKTFLVAQGFLSATDNTTDFFGEKTEAALKSFQKKHGISQTGMLGPLTRGKMKELAGQR